jgi:hypothetical protein
MLHRPRRRITWLPLFQLLYQIKRYTRSIMLTWPFQLAAICFLALIAIAQWLDWQAGIQERQLDCRFRRRIV